MDKFNEKKHLTLKKFIVDFVSKMNTRLLRFNHSPYQISNCLHFMDKCKMLPLSSNQKQGILAFLRNVTNNKEDSTLATRAGRFVRELELRTRIEPHHERVTLPQPTKDVPQKKPNKIIIDL